MGEINKKYSNGEVTIVWQPSKCIHSTICWRGENALPQVFNPKIRPWIQPENASTDQLIKHVNQCPSGALSILENEEKQAMKPPLDSVKISFVENGPIQIEGSFSLNHKQSNVLKKEESVFLCRCGHSKNKPYCDGSHVVAQFNTL